MIEVKKQGENAYSLFINGVRKDVRVRTVFTEIFNEFEREYIAVTSEDFNSSKELLDYKWNDFPSLRELDLRLQNQGQFTAKLLSELERVEPDRSVLSVTFSFETSLKDWKGNYTFSEYINEYRKLFEEFENFQGVLKFYDVVVVDYEVSFLIVPKNEKQIGELLLPYQKFLSKIHNKTLENLSLTNNQNLLLATFNFPDVLKVSCEQYLLYFAQFLRDLGINATSNLKAEAGKVLFSVTPTDDVEALDKIREALALYLHLPESPIIYNESFAAMRLQQQIENLLHSQKMTEREIRSSERELRFAQTLMEHQDKLILQKDAVIRQQNKFIEKITSTSIMMDSLENKEEFEKVFDGLEFGESKELKDKLGIKFNPVTSLKSLGKKLSGKAEEITSLNLSEETDKNN